MRDGQRRAGRALSCAAVILVCSAQIALAQDDSGSDAAPVAFSLTPDFFIHLILNDIIAAIAGVVIGAFFSPLFKRFRLYAALGAFVVLLLLCAVVHPLETIAVIGTITMPVIFIVALLFGLSLGKQEKPPRTSEPYRPTSLGSAKWATMSYLAECHLFEGRGFFLGNFITKGTPTALHYPGARHLLTVAPTRSGKGVSAIVPNLLTYEGSAFVIDPKGENALITAARRGNGDIARAIPGLDQAVFLVDPWDIAASQVGLTPARFNPLDWIKADDPDAAENAFLLADALVHQDASQGGGSERFWDEEAKALLTGVILFVATSPTQSTHRYLGRVRDIVMMGEKQLKDVLTQMSESKLPVVASTAVRTASKDPKLLSNVMAAVQSHTHFLDSPRIRKSLSASDFSFEQLKSMPMTVYLILPADRLKTFDRWLRLLIQQAITVNARNIRLKPEKPVLFLLDEMPSLGRLTMIEQAYGLMAGFGMQLWGIVQDLNQLQSLYGKEGWQTFISNSGVIQYFGSRDQLTAEYFSALCGVTTVQIRSLSTAIADAISRSHTHSSSLTGDSSSTTGSGTTYTHTVGSNEQQRKLAYADELMVLKGEYEIVFVENFDPIRATKVRWFDDPELRRLGVDLADDDGPPSPRQEPPSDATSNGVSADDIFKEFMTDFAGTAAAHQPEAEQPASPGPEPESSPPPEPEGPEPRVELRRVASGGGTVVTYTDNTVDFIDADGAVLSFASLAELKLYFRQRREDHPPDGKVVVYDDGAADFFKSDGTVESFPSLAEMKLHYRLQRDITPYAEAIVSGTIEVDVIGRGGIYRTFGSVAEMRLHFGRPA